MSFDRDKALRNAMLAFWRNGYETTSIADLTAAMGVTAPSIYTAFGDKKQLFLEAVRLYAGSSADLERSMFEAPTAREAARNMLLASVTAFTGETTPRGCLLASATASGSKASADVQDAVADVRRTIQALLARRIGHDMSEGLLPSDIDEVSLAAMVIAVIQGLSVLARDGIDRRLLTDVAETAMRAWPSSDKTQPL